MDGFFRRAGFKVHTLRERAADCPIPMKGHFFFNAWTTCTMLAEVLATYDTDVDLTILDRGFFDALIWLRLQRNRGQVSDEEAQVFEQFVLLERWRSLVDLTVVMTVRPDVAMEREEQGALVRRQGSLMNPTALAAFNKAIDEADAAHGSHFNVIRHVAEDTTVKDGALDLLGKLLPQIRSWAEQNVLVLPRAAVRSAFSDRPFLHGRDASAAWNALQAEVRVRLRSEVENDDDLVQVVGCGIPVHNDSLFVLTRSAKDEKNSYGRSTLWKGCHVEGQPPIAVEQVAKQVQSRVLQELHLKTNLQIEFEFLGMAWTENSKLESRHMGLLFKARIDDQIVAESLRDKEFRKASRGHTMTGTFQTPQQILHSVSELDLEPWSQFVILNIGLQVPV